jgi:hypothetical protein
MIEEFRRRFLGLGEVVHAYRDDAHRGGHELIRAAAACAMPLHVVHRAMKAPAQPIAKSFLGDRQVDIADSALLKAESATPRGDLRLERRHIGIAVLVCCHRQCRFLIG